MRMARPGDARCAELEEVGDAHLLSIAQQNELEEWPPTRATSSASTETLTSVVGIAQLPARTLSLRTSPARTSRLSDVFTGRQHGATNSV